MTSKHTHEAIRERGPYPFDGAAPGAAENRKAHGNISWIDVCVCGAERRTNVNGRHEEVGTWGPSRAQIAARDEAEVQATARAKAAQASLRAAAEQARQDERLQGVRQEVERTLRAVSPILVEVGGASVTIRLDNEGFVCSEAPSDLTLAAFRAAPTEWQQAALRAREAVLALASSADDT